MEEEWNRGGMNWRGRIGGGKEWRGMGWRGMGWRRNEMEGE